MYAAALVLVIQYVTGTGQVAGVTLNFGLEPAVCEAMAAEHDGKPHLEWVQRSWCQQEPPDERQLFSGPGVKT